MKFCLQLCPYLTDKSYGGDRVIFDMVEQAVLADKLGYESVSLTEHHLMNILMMPGPLQFAVHLAAKTENLNIITSVVVLPIHDMRTYAGEVVTTDILTDGRLMLGVGRGAFKFEIERLGVSMDETQDRFNESLDVLQALLTKEEVSWDGQYYQFDPITIMPRPSRPGGPELMMAVMNPEGIYHCTKRGFHIQTTPLAGAHQLLLDQVGAFNRAKDEMGKDGEHLTLSLSRLGFLTNSDDERTDFIQRADHYYAQFDNVFTGPGLLDNGMIRALPRKQTADELAEVVLIGGAQEMIDKLGVYQDLGLDRYIMNINIGVDQSRALECLQQFAEDVMPHFAE